MGAKSSLSLSGGAFVYVPCNESHRDDSKAVVYVIAVVVVVIVVVVVGGTTTNQKKKRRTETNFHTEKMPKFKVHSQYLYDEQKYMEIA